MNCWAVLPEMPQAAPEAQTAKAEVTVSTPVMEAPAVEAAPAVVTEVPLAEEALQAVPEAANIEEAVAEPVTEMITAEEIPPAVSTDDPVQELWQKLLTISGDVKELLLACTPVSLANSVLSVEAPAPIAAALRENRLKILTLLQQASGNWAILLDVQSIASAAETQAEEPEVPAEDPMDIPPAVPAEKFINIEEDTAIAENTIIPENIPEGTIAEESVEEFIELTLPEDPTAVSELSRADLGYSKRSVIHDPEEVEKTAKLPPVQKVLDLFGGEIVDIHA